MIANQSGHGERKDPANWTKEICERKRVPESIAKGERTLQCLTSCSVLMLFYGYFIRDAPAGSLPSFATCSGTEFHSTSQREATFHIHLPLALSSWELISSSGNPSWFSGLYFSCCYSFIFLSHQPFGAKRVVSSLPSQIRFEEWANTAFSSAQVILLCNRSYLIHHWHMNSC